MHCEHKLSEKVYSGLVRLGGFEQCCSSLLIKITTHTHTQPFYCSSGTCPGPPRWAGTRKVKPER